MTVHIIDKDNKLELELNRNSISNIDFIRKEFFRQIILQLSNSYIRQRHHIEQLCGTSFDCQLLTNDLYENDLIKRAYVLTENGYSTMGFLSHLDIVNRRLIVLDRNPGNILIQEILQSHNHPLLVVEQPCELFLKKRINSIKMVWERLISRTPTSLFQSESYGDIKYVSQLFSKYGWYRKSDPLKGKVVIYRNEGGNPVAPFLSKDLYEKLIDAGCQIAEYTIQADSPYMDGSIFSNVLFSNYVSSTLKENIILPYL